LSTVAVLLDIEEGHMLAIAGLLRLLKARGHRVCCLGFASIKDLVCDQGLEFISIMENIFPEKSYRIKNWLETRDRYFGPLARGEVLDEVIARLKPDVMVVHNHYYAESLVIHYRYRLPIVSIVPSLRQVGRVQACESNIVNTLMNFSSGVAELLDLLTDVGVRFKNLKEVAQLTLNFPELILNPEAFELPGRGKDPGVHYIGDGIDLSREEEPITWLSNNSDRPLIYCALGSQSSYRKEASFRFFQVAIEAAETRSDWQFVIALGKTFDAGCFTPVPSNVTLVNWAPQLSLLARSDVMVNHGGYGTVKECILMGVPMVVFPLLLDRDHVGCAERVVYHGLGMRGDIDQVSSVEMISLIEQVIMDQSFRNRVCLMREKFKQENHLDVGVKVIEDAVATSKLKGGVIIEPAGTESEI
jgi:MGT family glycosyltransferase